MPIVSLIENIEIEETILTWLNELASQIGKSY